MASSNAESGVTRSKVRWHCWKARILFPILLLASSGMIWFGVRMHRASCQRAAVAAIKGAHGVVDYDFEVDCPGEPKVNRTPPGPSWLRAWLGVDFLADVVSADVSKAAEMQYLKAFPKLETLRLSGPEITDAEMKYVEELPQLQLFSLSRTSVTDAGVAHVKALSQLHWLGFVAISLTDAGLTHLKGLTKLECVLFHCTDVTDAGVAELQRSLPDCHIDADTDWRSQRARQQAELKAVQADMEVLQFVFCLASIPFAPLALP